jgi:transposase InsO family protein
MADEVHDAGITVSDRTVWARCAEQQTWFVFGKKRNGKAGRPGPPVINDHVQLAFAADRPNQPWLVDITEHRAGEGKPYLCADQGRVQQPDRRLRDRRPHESITASERSSMLWPAAATWPDASCTTTG